MHSGMIGNSQYGALINPQSNITWLCWPQFDSSFVFGSILDEDKGGHFSIQSDSKENIIFDQEYFDQTVILKTTIKTTEGSYEIIDFAPRWESEGMMNTPNILIRLIHVLEGKPVIRVRCNPVYDYGAAELKPLLSDDSIDFEGASETLRLWSDIDLESIVDSDPIELQGTHFLALSWGDPEGNIVQNRVKKYFKDTYAYWTTWVKQLKVPEKYNEEVIRSALTLKLHQFEETGAFIAALTMSLPQEAKSERTWDYRYCWIRDAALTIQAFWKLGLDTEIEMFASYILELYDQNDFPWAPLYSIDGERDISETVLPHLKGYENCQPVRVGNEAYKQTQTDVYGFVVMALEPLFYNEAPQEDLPFDFLEKLIQQVDKVCLNADQGFWEIRNTTGLHASTLIVHWTAAERVLKIGQKFQNNKLINLSKNIMEKVTVELEKCWQEQEQVYSLSSETKHLDSTLSMLINFDYLKDKDKALNHIQNMWHGLGGEDGLMLRFQGEDHYGQPKTAITICSFWLVQALAKLGKKKEAEKIFKSLLSYGNTLGLFAENLELKTKKQWGNFPQIYSHLALIEAAFCL